MTRVCGNFGFMLIALLAASAEASGACASLERLPPGEPRVQCANYPCPPAYPRSALLAGQHGKVLLGLTVSSSGKASSVSVLVPSQYPTLDKAAIRSAQETTFPLYHPSGKGSPMCYKVAYPVEFTLP
jgi:TonB family protein